jgi:hypothetical protein
MAAVLDEAVYGGDIECAGSNWGLPAPNGFVLVRFLVVVVSCLVGEMVVDHSTALVELAGGSWPDHVRGTALGVPFRYRGTPTSSANLPNTDNDERHHRRITVLVWRTIPSIDLIYRHGFTGMQLFHLRFCTANRRFYRSATSSSSQHYTSAAIITLTSSPELTKRSLLTSNSSGSPFNKHLECPISERSHVQVRSSLQAEQREATLSSTSPK